MSVTVERALTRDQLEKVRGTLAARGFTLAGEAGTFEADTAIGRVAGSYAYAEGKLAVSVSKHPPFLGGTVKRGIERGIEEAIS